jgi:aspartate/methionine/tyrosine aminotransferase
VQLKPFRIEQYYAKYEFTARYMLSSSDAESRTVQQLLDLEPGAQEAFSRLWLGYTESPGAPYLREAIAGIYQRTAADDVLVIAAAEEGIFLAYHALLGPGDHAIVETPCYESALEVACSTGAEVSTWERRYEDGWANDFTALERLIRPNTGFIYINTPNNPTGTQMDKRVLERVMELAQERGIFVFCDEVYRELEHDPSARLPAACDLYENAISLGSMSKTYGLPGLRTGWLASRNPELLCKCRDLKDYTTICSPAPSEFLSALALRHREVLVKRNLDIVHANLPLLEAFFAHHSDLFEWVKPVASPIGFPRFKGNRDVTEFCEEVVRETSVLLLPGSVYDQPRHLRFGFGRKNMPEALGLLEGWLSEQNR